MCVFHLWKTDNLNPAGARAHLSVQPGKPGTYARDRGHGKLEMERERGKEERGARRLERLHLAGERRCTVAALENALIAM